HDAPRRLRRAATELPRQQLLDLFDDDRRSRAREGGLTQLLFIDAPGIDHVRFEELALEPIECRRCQRDARAGTDAPLTIHARALHQVFRPFSANAVASARDDAPSPAKSSDSCISTDCSVVPIASAISAFVFPSISSVSSRVWSALPIPIGVAISGISIGPASSAS